MKTFTIDLLATLFVPDNLGTDGYVIPASIDTINAVGALSNLGVVSDCDLYVHGHGACVSLGVDESRGDVFHVRFKPGFNIATFLQFLKAM